MKNFKFLLLLLFPLALTSCGKSYLLSDDTTTLTVAVSPTPHGIIMEKAAKILAPEGYTINIKTFNDYVQPNLATESGDVDANYFQHLPYLENFNEENNTHLVSVVAVHYEPLGIYAGKLASLDDVSSGISIAVPNDTTNEARALLLLQANGLLTLNEGAGLDATKLDIATNPYNINIIEMEAAQIPNALSDVAFGVINGNYALSADLPAALALESKNSLAAETYANILVVRDGNQNNPAVQALAGALTSDAMRDFITATFGDSVVPVF